MLGRPLYVCVFLLFLSSYALHGQEQPDNREIASIEQRLIPLGHDILNGTNDEERFVANLKFLDDFRNLLSLPGSFSYPFDSLVTISKLSSNDEKIRIYTWNLPLDDGTFQYYGFLQYRAKKQQDIQLFELNDQSEKLESEEFKKLNFQNWYGALYYQMIENKYDGTTYYTLLGWKGNNAITTKKVIDVLSFDDSGQPVFGFELFLLPKRERKHRIVYEFSAEVSMSMLYDKSREAIICDHLFPSRPDLKGHPEFYGPDLSFDAFILEKGRWKMIEDYDPGLRPDNKEIKLKEEKRLYDSSN